MNLHIVVLTAVYLSATAATCQEILADQSPPNACELLSRSDLNTLLPDADVAKIDENLSPLSRGIQYVASCLYRIDLHLASGGGPRPYVSLAVVRWQGATRATNSPQEGMADLLANLGESGAKPPTILTEAGDEAFSLQVGQESRIYAREGDLIFLVSVDSNFAEASKLAINIAALAAERWGGKSASAQSSEPIKVTAPETDSAMSASSVWPNACKVLPETDVKRAVPEAKLVENQAISGLIRFDNGEERALPEPIGCWYTLRRGSGAAVITTQVQLTLENVLPSALEAADYYALSLDVSGAGKSIKGIGEAAAMDDNNKITVLQGNVVFHLRVTGGETDVALHDEAAEVAKKLAASVVARLDEQGFVPG
jgi:hypothetical protein